jgi:hypothetical protein
MSGSGCITNPGQPSSVYSPPKIIVSNNLGWNAGADSTDVLDGDLHTVFTMGAVTSAVNGLKSTRVGPTIPALIDYAFEFFTFQGQPLFCVAEKGKVVTATFDYAAGDQFEIRRAGEFVEYLYNDKRIYTSTKHSVGPLSVDGCMYVAGDTIG